MNKLTYLKLIGLSLMLTCVISFASALGVILNLNINGMILLQTLAFLLSASFLTMYMRKKDTTLINFGFIRKKVDKRIYCFIILIIFIQPFFLGIDFSLNYSTIFLLVVQMLLVGYTEEVLFRSIYYYFLKKKSSTFFILFSSITFGILHIASVLNPNTTIVLVILQIINALLLGVVFAVLYLITKTIYIVILFHSLFNIFASICLPGIFINNMTAVLLLSCLYLLFLLYYRLNSKIKFKLLEKIGDKSVK
ncbi:CPBP family intramembrane glutamic endopeptidase [Enterococcus sp. LJL99]